MTFLVRHGAPLYAAQLHARALEGWRAAARLVSVRRNGVLIADRGCRDDAFATYLLALDAEAAAGGSGGRPESPRRGIDRHRAA
jgi:hypothetical protein